MFYTTACAIYTWKARQEAESDPEDYEMNEHFSSNLKDGCFGNCCSLFFLNRPSSVTVCLQRPSPLPTESSRVSNPEPRLGRTIHLKFPRCPHLQAYVPSVGKSKRRACKATVGHLSTLVSELPNTWQLCSVLSNYSFVVFFTDNATCSYNSI